MFLSQHRQKFLGKSPPVDGQDLIAVGGMAAAMWGQATLEAYSQANQLQGVMHAIMFGQATLDVPDTRTLPCIEYPYRIIEIREILHSDTRTGAPLIASKTRRITQHEIELDWSNLDDLERSMLNNAWQDGDGCFRRFQVTLPGEASPRWCIFRDDAFAINQLNAAIAGATVTLLDVTRAGEN